MCYICGCFAYAIDFIQRIITCCLLCLLSCAVCCGFTIAIIAGIAYGYNYSLAEFLQFTRSDVTVFMRRGQFYDKPDMEPGRRSDGGEAIIMSNQTADYEDSGSKSQPLAETWLQSQDTRQYAEKLTKYTPLPADHFVLRPEETGRRAQVERYKSKLQEFKPSIISSTPNPLLATRTGTWQTGSSEIVMRKYQPLEDNPSNNFLFNTDFQEGVHKVKNSAEKASTEGDYQRVASVHVWSSIEPRVTPDYITEDIDDDGIIYKPV